MEYVGYCPCCGAAVEVEAWCEFCGSVREGECVVSLSPSE
jgi:hypothetical protein